MSLSTLIKAAVSSVAEAVYGGLFLNQCICEGMLLNYFPIQKMIVYNKIIGNSNKSPAMTLAYS